MSQATLTVADWEPEMVEYRGGDHYRANSYVDELRSEQTVRRIHYTCDAIRLDLQNWGITYLQTRP